MADTISREGVIAKIKALFERTTENGCTEAEAIAAALAAQRLIVRHNVTDAELSERCADEPIVEVCSSEVSRNWASELALVIARSFRCKTYRHQVGCRGGKMKNFVFMGYETDAAAARVAFDYLYRVGTELANQEARRQRELFGGYSSRGIRPSFCTGFARGVGDELERQSVALMVVTPQCVEDAFKERTAGWGTWTARTSLTDPTAYGNGRRAGRDAARARSVEGRLGICA